MISILNKFFNIAYVAVVALAVSIGAASAKNKSIVETAVQAGNFNTLVAALKAASLIDTLNGKGPLTVFRLQTWLSLSSQPKQWLAC